MSDWGGLLEFCETDRQREIIELRRQGLSVRQVSERVGIAGRNVQSACSRVRAAAARQGYSPEHDMHRTVPKGFSVKGVSTYYNDDGQPVGQWVKSQADTQALFEQALEDFKQGLVEDVQGKAKPVDKPTDNKDKNLAACYLIGDHHLGLRAWNKETGQDDYDIGISCKLLFNAMDTLTHASKHAHTGILVNLGDFFHANNIKNETGSGTPLDVDGRAGMVIEAAGRLYKRLITRMLESHKEVWIINVRGNHDPDAALWLNAMIKMYYENEPRVKVFDNYNKFINFTWGDNLVVMHHGDKINVQRIYETITRVLAKEWGESKHRFAWTGHIHHKQAHEIGGLNHESWNVLPPPDAWHAASGYGSSRSMTAVLLHKTFGEHSRFKVGADQL
jgi:UDP-2,3-diacylglucosamine pyrophosphatase LpxH